MKKQAGILLTRANIDNATINVEEKTFEVVFATETPVYRSPYWADESFYEVLACDKKSIRGQRLDEGVVPLVDNHQTWSITSQYGTVLSWSIKDNECRAVVKYTTQEAKQDMWSDIVSGVLRSISCGYRVWQYERIPDKDPKKTPTYRAVDWEAMEISLVPVPADYKSSVRGEKEDNHEIEIINHNENRSAMPEHENGGTPATETPAATVTPPAQGEVRSADNGGQPLNPTAETPDEATRKATDVERKRGIDIRTAVRNAKLDEKYADELVKSNKTVDEARAAIIEKLAESDINIANNGSGGARVNGDEHAATRAAMVEGLMQRAVPGSVRSYNKLVDKKDVDMDARSHDFKHLSLLELSKRCLQMRGESNTDRMSPMEIAKRAMDTTDMPDLFTTTVQRFLRMYYEPIVPEWLSYSREVNANDFRVKTGVKVDAAVTFEELTEDGEYKESTMMSDDKATIQLQTFGRKLSITRKTIINDDLNVLSRIPQLIGIGARQFQSRKFWNMLINNANCPDGNPIFCAAHNNIGTGKNASVINDASLSAARTAMRRQKSPEGNELMIFPSRVMVPAELETTVQKQLRPINATQTSNVNLWMSLNPDVNIYLTDPLAWYMFADLGMSGVDGFVHSYLSGQEGLFTESFIDKATDNLVIKARLDFATAVWGWQGMYKNTGAAATSAD